VISAWLDRHLQTAQLAAVKKYRGLNSLLGFRVHYWGVSSFLDTEWLLSTLFDASL
jgi:hypothetical protein